MRLRLIASFLLIVLVAIMLVVIIAVRQTASEVRTFMFRGGLTNTDRIVTALERHYDQHGSWEGVETLIPATGQANRQGMGMGTEQNPMRGPNPPAEMPHLRLLDPQGRVLFDTRHPEPDEQLTEDALARAVPLGQGWQFH